MFKGNKIIQALPLVLASSVLSSYALADQADEPVYKLHIKSQPLLEALKLLSDSTGLEVLYFTQIGEGVRADKISGSYTREQALSILLANTDLEAVYLEGQEAVSIRKKTEDNTKKNRKEGDLENSGNVSDIEEVIVTSRKRGELLREVPDSITAFTGREIESMGIQEIGDFVAFTPNMVMNDNSSFSSHQSSIAMRGITGGTRYVIDGVPLSNGASIFSGTLADVERIEVLRGPQSVLFGAGSIAGAVNIVTRKPSNELEGKVKAGYAKGNDKTISGLISGPIIDDKLYFLLNGNYRNSDGLIQSGSNSIDMAFVDREQINVRLLYTPTDNFELDLNVHILQEEKGADYTSKVPSIDLASTFNSSTGPRRRVAGLDEREVNRISLKATWDMNWATFSSLTGYEDTEQDLRTSGCWDDPDDPAVDGDLLTPGIQAECSFVIPVGSTAMTGEAIDTEFQFLQRFETWTQDIRLTSSDDQRLRWVFGVDFLYRERISGFDFGVIMGPAPGTFDNRFPSWSGGDETWWGAYGQASYDVTDKMELTLAARHDDNKHENTAYTSRDLDTVIPGFGPGGSLVDVQTTSRDGFQPKAQLSYKLNDESMIYVTWSKGYKAGFWSSRNVFVEPETTVNYEMGVKTILFDYRLGLNAAIFHIDYADKQQFTFTEENDDAFGETINIPESNIDGAEIEVTLNITDALVLSTDIGYVDGHTIDGVRPAWTPRWTASAQLDYRRPLNDQWDLIAHADYSYEGEQINNASVIEEIESDDFVNFRIGVDGGRWRGMFFVKNAFNRIGVESALNPRPASTNGAYIRGQNLPRSYGIELICTF